MGLEFSEFDKQSKVQWLKAAINALKGRAYETLHWKVDESITMEPYYTDTLPRLSQVTKNNNNWHIGETFNGDNSSLLNEQLIKALEFGLDSPLLLDVKSYDACLDHVRVDFLFPLFRDCKLNDYISWLETKNLNTTDLQGGFYIYEADGETIDLTPQLSDLRTISKVLPQYYHSHTYAAIDLDNLGESLGTYLLQLSEVIYQLMCNDIPVKVICELETSNDFIKNICIIRALRSMMDQICSTYKIPTSSILIDAYVYQQAMDMQLGMIGASSQALSAVTAGVDRLTIICESMNVQMSEEASRRMNRNVHHVLKLESGLDKVSNPLGGSYSIERLTSTIAEQSWKVFQKG